MIAMLPLLARLAWPGALFSRLHALPWYGDLLRRWALAGVEPGQRLLEMGCAGGDLAADLVTAGAEVVAVERSHRAAWRAQRHARGARIVRGDALSAEVPLDTFDVVLAASLLNVVPDPVRLLARMGAHARPGGVVRVLVPDQAFDDAALQRLAEHLHLSRHGTSRAALELWHRAARKMSEPTLRTALVQAGLQPVRVSRDLGGLVLSADASRPGGGA
jgi:SAM-dependent methyltransferase